MIGAMIANRPVHRSPFRIVASGLSPRAVERARREADTRGIVAEFRVALLADGCE